MIATARKHPKLVPKIARPRSKVPENETKAEKFKRLAVRRVSTALKALEAVTRLSAIASYEYSPEQVEKLITALGEAMLELQQAYGNGKKAKTPFEL